MPRIYRIRDFNRHQHYRTRTPPWIKLYNALLEDYAFGLLPDTAKAHYLSLCLLASRHDNAIMADADWVAKRINATAPVDLALLEEKGFLIAEDVESIPLAPCKQNACPEREGETEAETEEEEIQMSDPSDLFDTGKPKPEKIERIRKTYPPAFEAFWAEYPTDPLMSKKCAFAKWRLLPPADQAAAKAAIAAFKNYCARNPDYRPVHAERFLSQRRFDGFAVAEAPKDTDALRALWGGAAGPLVDAVGPDLFKAYFAEVKFSPGPPVVFYASTVFRRDMIMEKFSSQIWRLFGEDAIVALRTEAPQKMRA